MEKTLYQLAKGKPGKKVSKKEFVELFKDNKPGGHKFEYQTKDGYIYKADSRQEITLIKKLSSRFDYKALRGQCLSIPYKYKGKKREYYPDLVVLTKTNKIVIIEVKEVVQMVTKLNLRKYRALKNYAESRGYLYMMCDKNFVTLESLSDRGCLKVVQTSIEKALEDKKAFTYEDYLELVDGCDRKEKRRIRKSIGVYVASNLDNLKVATGDFTNCIKNLRVIERKK